MGKARAASGERLVKFNRAEFDTLKRVQRDVVQVIEELDRAESCDIDCQELRTLLSGIMSRTQAIEREFMTPAPTR